MPPAANPPDDALTGADLPAETDAGPARGGKASVHTPERRCIATMQSRPQGEMIRFVLSPDGEVTPDLAARLPGRGAWVTADREALDMAVRKNAFARAFRAPAKAASDLPARVEALLVRRLLDQLGLAKRAGDLILGYEKVREAIRGAAPACLIEASDGSEDGRGKLLALLRGVHGPEGGSPNSQTAANRGFPPVIGCFSSDELGMALGRERVIHACLKQGRFASSWIGELARLSGFRRVWPDDWSPLDLRPAAAASPSGAAERRLEDRQARVSGGNPPAPRGATEVSE